MAETPREEIMKTSPRTTLGGSTRTFREPVHDDGYFDDLWSGTATTAVDDGPGAGGAIASVGASSDTKGVQLSSTVETSQPRRKMSLHAWFLSRVAGSTRGDVIDDLEEDDMNEAPYDALGTNLPLEHSQGAHGAASDTEQAEATTAGAAAAAAETSQPIDRNVLIEAIIEHHTPGDDDCTPELQSCDVGKQTPSNAGLREEALRGPKLNMKARLLPSSSWTGIFDDRDPPFRELNVYEEFAGDEPGHSKEIEIEAASEAKGHVNFLSTTMGLTVDVSGALQPFEGEHDAHGDHDDWPASPCNGVIMETSPRYSVLQTFRKQMCSRGIDAQVGSTYIGIYCIAARTVTYFAEDVLYRMLTLLALQKGFRPFFQVIFTQKRGHSSCSRVDAFSGTTRLELLHSRSVGQGFASLYLAKDLMPSVRSAQRRGLYGVYEAVPRYAVEFRSYLTNTTLYLGPS